MTFRQFILRPAARIAAIRAWVQTRAFLNAHTRTQQTQDDLLARLVARHAETAFGRDHGFSEIRNYTDFAAAVPVRNYEQLKDYFDRVFHGETTALLPADEPVLMFSMTSGTTGEPKHIPVTQPFLENMQAGFNILGLSALNAHKEGWLRPILQISSPMDEMHSPTGLPCGAISGFIAANQQKIVRRMYPAPFQVASIEDPTSKYYTLMRCGIVHDVAIISTANPSSIIKLIETAQDHAETLIRDVADGTFSPPQAVAPEVRRHLHFKPNRRLASRLEAHLAADGTLLPKHFWNPAFLTHWTGGTLKLYLKRIRELFGDVPVRDIGLLASEGRFSIPLTDNTPAGIAEITGNVLEFIPTDQHDRTDPDVLRAHEVQVGQEYFLVVTNCAGLWRYNIDDRVRIVSRFGQSPVFEFLCRGTSTSSMTGEKITECQVVEAMRRAAARAGAAVERFTFQPVFAKTPCYQLTVEADGSDPAALPELMDAELAELNLEYRGKRHGSRLGPVRLVSREAGFFEKAEREAIARRRGRSEQYKHQYLLTDVVEET